MHDILILGAGYAGLCAATNLAGRVRRRDDVRITLVNPEERFTERLRLHSTASGRPTADLRVPDLLAQTKINFVRGWVTAIDADARTARIDDERDLRFDTLVYALGSAADTSVPGAAEHAYALDSFRDAEALAALLETLAAGPGSAATRSAATHNAATQSAANLGAANQSAATHSEANLGAATRNAATLGAATHSAATLGAATHSAATLGAATRSGPAPVAATPSRATSPAATVIVGGTGLTGVEAAAEIAEGHPALTVRLVGRDTPGRTMTAKAQRYLLAALDRLGVDVHAGAEITKVLPGAVELDGTGTLAADAVLWTAGTRVSPLAAAAGLTVDDRGRIVTDQTLRSVSHPHVYAVGDAAAVRQEFGLLHGTCQSGMPTGVHAAVSIARELAGKPPARFRFGYYHAPVSLGRGDAVVQFTHPDDSPRRAHLTGRAAVWYKETVTASPWPTFARMTRFPAIASWWPRGGRYTR